MRAQFSHVEFSRPHNASQLGVTVKIEANVQERDAVAKRLELLSLSALSAELTITADSAGVVHVRGQFEAAFEQACVVSLEPILVKIDEEMAERYAEQAILQRLEKKNATQETEDDDLPELIEDGFIDLGEAVVQNLILSLDPYPRKAGLDYLNLELE